MPAELPSSGEGSRDPLLVAILGPTASGKTALALAVAERFGGEIVNCDAVAIYRQFEIGTAKPGAEERARVPHHLIDILDPTELCTAGDYARRARVVLEELKRRGRLPVVAGGTGFYLRALLEGLSQGPQRSNELRERLRRRAGDTQRGSAYLHRMLTRLDPGAARKIHPHDASKLVRALEVCLLARRPMSELWRRGRDPLQGFRLLRLGLDPERSALYQRINRRARDMFDRGLAEETAALVARYGDAARPLGSLGYVQAGKMIRGEMGREGAIMAAQQAHRNYAKRQMTWFRREPDVHWLRGFGDDEQVQREGLESVSAAL